MGPINYVIAPKAAHTTILNNFGAPLLKILIQNHSAHAAVALEFSATPGAANPPPSSLGVPPLSTVVVAVGISCHSISAFNSSHNEGSALISVIYE